MPKRGVAAPQESTLQSTTSPISSSDHGLSNSFALMTADVKQTISLKTHDELNEWMAMIISRSFPMSDDADSKDFMDYAFFTYENKKELIDTLFVQLIKDDVDPSLDSDIKAIVASGGYNVGVVDAEFISKVAKGFFNRAHGCYEQSAVKHSDIFAMVEEQKARPHTSFDAISITQMMGLDVSKTSGGKRG